MPRLLPDVSAVYQHDGRPRPLARRAARAAARQYFADRPQDRDAWCGFVLAWVRGSGQQIVRVQIGRPWPHRMLKLGVVKAPRTGELVAGMRLVDPSGHRGVVLAPPPRLSIDWRHYTKPVFYGDEPDASWMAAV